MVNNSYCEFCDEFSGSGSNSFAARYGNDLKDRKVLETDNLTVVPSLGHFVKGYLLLIPKLHYCALGDMPSEIARELAEVQRSLIRRLSPLYGRYTFFEHGARTPGSGGCGIYHAHLHALPLDSEGVLRQLRDQFPHKRVGSLLDLKEATSGASYLYYEDPSAQSWLFFPTALPSQYMRRLIAEEMGISGWDWRSSGREEAFLATRSEVAKLLSAGA